MNAVIQVLASAPGSPTAGLIYYDSALGQFGIYDGLTSAWVYAGTGAAPATSGVEGIVQLAGDLAGTGSTAAAPTVGNLHLTADTAIGHKLTSVTDPTSAQDAATKNYVDNAINGLQPKASVVAATTAALPANTYSAGVLTATANAALAAQDGVTLTVGQRLLVKNEATTANNGIYTVTTVGDGTHAYVLTRTNDAATWAELVGALIPIDAGGTTLGDTLWLSTCAVSGTLGTTAVGFTQIQSATQVTGDGTYTTKVGNLIELLYAADIASLPANGAVSTATVGAAQTAKSALTGDGSTTVFTITHGFGVKQLQVTGQLNNSGAAGAPIELDWAPGTTNTITVTFPTAPAAGVSYFVNIQA